MTDPRHRPIRSFVRREGRLTPGQQKALDELLPQHSIPPAPKLLDFHQLFNNRNPVVLEIGFGNGTLLAEQAVKHPEFNFIGIEVHRPGVGRLLQEIDRQGMTNIKVMSEDAVEVLNQRIPTGSLSAIWLYFPDPWPKKRHHKRRIVNPLFLSSVACSLTKDGIIHMATDWQDYADDMLYTLQQHPDISLINTPDSSTYPFHRPLTHFEKRGRRKGHAITDLYATINKT